MSTKIIENEIDNVETGTDNEIIGTGTGVGAGARNVDVHNALAGALVSTSSLISRRGGGKGAKNKFYYKYELALRPHLAFLLESIEESENGTIVVPADALAKAMGGSFGQLKFVSLMWGVKFTLFRFGIVVDSGTVEGADGTDVKALVLRAKVEGDVLPASLAEHLKDYVETA